MGELESYLTGEYARDRRDIADIEELLDQVVDVYATNFDMKKAAWPYRVPNEGGKSNKLSQSTTAMIVAALLRYLGAYGDRQAREIGNESRANFLEIKVKSAFRDAIGPNIARAGTLLLGKIVTGTGQATTLSTDSGTFGTDDVFTLAWLAEVSVADWSPYGGTLAVGWKRLQRLLLAKAEKKRTAWKRSTFTDPTALLDPGTGAKALSHAFPALRLVQMIRRIRGVRHGPLQSEYRYFENLLHEQLSFSSIPDSRFDPAELMFCLEGMLLCQRNVVDRTLFDRVIDVLTTVQTESAYWRPVKPYLASDQGLVLQPVSVEVANSLLRACTIFDGAELHDTYGSKCIGLFRRYWQWLKAREVRTPDGKHGEWVGWHSEHVNNPGVMHLWETSQVVEFLLAYRNALQAHVARTTLIRSRFKFNNFHPAGKPWVDFQRGSEPVSRFGSDWAIYQRIGENFVQPFLQGDPKNFSMLLYGPPGTGKTNVSKNIAAALGLRLITLTVSDFLAEGGAQVEARAKYIFEVLHAQPPCIVLFDEIDHFLLDRDSERYSTQETVFQFMTPGMLTKLADLREAARSIFIVATNYEDRIDAAIKRTGRIDQKFLVLPPDRQRRATFLNEFLGGKKPKFTDAQIDSFARVSVFLGYSDLRAAVNSVSGRATAIQMRNVLIARARTTSLEAYRRRLVVVKETGEEVPIDIRQTPIVEFLCLLAVLLEAEAVESLEPSKRDVIRSAALVLQPRPENPITPSLVATHLRGLAPKTLKSVVEALKACR